VHGQREWFCEDQYFFSFVKVKNSLKRDFSHQKSLNFSVLTRTLWWNAQEEK